MINWFGPSSWGAPICSTSPRCDVPVGDPCARCRRPFVEADSGVTMPQWPDGVSAFHLDCHLKSMLPHTQWPMHGLVPDEFDGLVNGEFYCRRCGMQFKVGYGWSRRLVGIDPLRPRTPREDEEA